MWPVYSPERSNHMDVHCSTCEEPCDVYHLWHDAIFKTGLTPEQAKAWCSLPQSQKLSNEYRKEFETEGWKFGQSVINVTLRKTFCPLFKNLFVLHPVQQAQTEIFTFGIAQFNSRQSLLSFNYKEDSFPARVGGTTHRPPPSNHLQRHLPRGCGE
jgi:hypothetical protein